MGDEADTPLFGRCEVTSVCALWKKGHFLVELLGASRLCLQVVTDRSDVAVGCRVLVAMLGAQLAGGVRVLQRKIAGEMSQGSIVEVLDSPVTRDADEVQDSASDGEGTDEEVDAAPAFRVLQRASPAFDPCALGCLEEVGGDATNPDKGKGNRIIAHCCNDLGIWSAGFAYFLSSKKHNPHIAREYRRWGHAGSAAGFELGAVLLVDSTPAHDRAAWHQGRLEGPACALQCPSRGVGGSRPARRRDQRVCAHAPDRKLPRRRGLGGDQRSREGGSV